MVCIMLLCSGVQLFCLGIVGEYLAKTYWRSSTARFISQRRPKPTGTRAENGPRKPLCSNMHKKRCQNRQNDGDFGADSGK